MKNGECGGQEQRLSVKLYMKQTFMRVLDSKKSGQFHAACLLIILILTSLPGASNGLDALFGF